MDDMNADLWDRYMESSFSEVNILTEEQYEKGGVQFGHLYEGYLPRDKGSCILDLGAGAGHFLYFLKQKGYDNFLGIDISEQQVKYCREKISDRVMKADATEFLRDKCGEYDLITAHDMLEHVPKEKVIPLVQLIYSSLKKDGIFILRVPNMSNPFSLDSRYGDFTHEVGYTGKSLKQILSLTGFNEIEILYKNKVPPKTLRNRVRRVMVNAFQGVIRFFYYIQDFSVPKCLDKNIVVAARKSSKGNAARSQSGGCC